MHALYTGPRGDAPVTATAEHGTAGACGGPGSLRLPPETDEVAPTSGLAAMSVTGERDGTSAAVGSSGESGALVGGGFKFGWWELGSGLELVRTRHPSIHPSACLRLLAYAGDIAAAI